MYIYPAFALPLEFSFFFCETTDFELKIKIKELNEFKNMYDTVKYNKRS